jgi:hypothetical protein
MEVVFRKKFMYDESITKYGGVITGEWQEYIQSKEKTCGQAGHGFLFVKYGHKNK